METERRGCEWFAGCPETCLDVTTPVKEHVGWTVFDVKVSVGEDGSLTSQALLCPSHSKKILKRMFPMLPEVLSIPAPPEPAFAGRFTGVEWLRRAAVDMSSFDMNELKYIHDTDRPTAALDTMVLLDTVRYLARTLDLQSAAANKAEEKDEAAPRLSNAHMEDILSDVARNWIKHAEGCPQVDKGGPCEPPCRASDAFKNLTTLAVFGAEGKGWPAPAGDVLKTVLERAVPVAASPSAADASITEIVNLLLESLTHEQQKLLQGTLSTEQLKLLAELLERREASMKISPRAAVQEGWAMPLLSKKAHYFVESKSICGKWMYTGELTGNQGGKSPDDCKECERRLARR